ncbi:hypothetical protein B0H11DRAFT_1926234, partial [Mycena galericulata]
KRNGKQRELNDECEPSEGGKAVRGKGKTKNKSQEDEVEPLVKPKAKTAARKRARDPDPPEDTEDIPVKKRKPASQAKEDDDPPARQRLEVIMEEDEDEEAPPEETPVMPPAKKKVAEKPKAITDSAIASSKKRPRDKIEDATETSAQRATKRPETSAKRGKTVISKDEDAAHVQIASRVLKENASKPLPVTKPPPVLPAKRSGPPKSVLDRVTSSRGPASCRGR